MKVLLDECLPRRLKNAFPEHQCQTVPEAGFAGKKNGILLGLAESSEFSVFLTIDKGLQYQQNLTGRKISIIIMRAKSNRLDDLLPLTESCRSAINSIGLGDIVRLGGQSSDPTASSEPAAEPS